MLHRDIFIPHLLCLILRMYQHLIQIGTHIKLTALHLHTFLQGTLHTFLKMFCLDAHFLNEFHNQTVIQSNQAVQQVLLLHFLIAVFISKLFQSVYRLHGILCKFRNVHNRCLPFSLFLTVHSYFIPVAFYPSMAMYLGVSTFGFFSALGTSMVNRPSLNFARISSWVTWLPT